MKVTDYVIEFIIGKGITDMFGYPGGGGMPFDGFSGKIP